MTVQFESEDRYLVVVQEGDKRSRHLVTVRPDERIALGGSTPAEELIETSFEFLLEREPQESILSQFELPVIGQYFPDYPTEIRRRLAG
ncbi:MAG: hypothetical protein HKN80_15510 [Acidimicrobiia bacterium]|nr:hypothetical protein [Acidimicrobiia bacterium]